MKVTVDENKRIITVETDGGAEEHPLYSKEAFEIISKLWLKVGWNEKYPYTFSWFGRPVIQLPEDMIRIQEVIYRIQPDVIIETGVAHGGSIIFYASICKAIGKGRVIGVDIEIRPHNRQAIESHELFPLITLIEGSSIDESVVEEVKKLINPGEKVLVILDSKHTKQHVLDELDAYGQLVTPGSYIVATDGSMRDLHDVPRGDPEWLTDNPAQAATEFAELHQEFVLEQLQWPFNESELTQDITHWPNAWLRKASDS